ncbi:MAG: hypothetical protein ABJD68_03235 [Nakamurella sp.]
MLAARPSCLHRWLAVAAALLMLAGTAGCTSADDAAPAAAVRTAVQKVWTATGIDPVSPVQNVGGVAVVYGTTPAGLMIYGLDPTTGAQLWSKPTIVPSADSGGFAWAPRLDTAVTYFRPTGTDRLTQLVLADPKTGVDESVSAARYWSTHPPTCTSDSLSVCLNAYVQDDDGDFSSRTFRVSQSTGHTAPVSTSPPVATPGVKSLPVNGLYYTTVSDGQPAMLGRWVDNASLWAKPMVEVFGAGLPAPQRFEMPAEQNAELGTLVAYGEAPNIADRAPLDLSTNVVSSVFSLADGSSTWMSQGAWLGCGGDPMLARTGGSVDSKDGYLCRYTGSATRTAEPEFSSNLITSNLRVVLERIDQATGAPSWSTEVGDAKRLASDTTGAESALLDDTTLFEPNSTGGLVIDLENGHTRPPTAGDIFWCEEKADFIRSEPEYQASTPSVRGEIDGVYRTCTSTGDDAPLPSSQIPSAIGASFDQQIRVIALKDGVTGFLVPPVAAAPTDQSAADSAAATPSGAAAPSAVASAIPSGAAVPPVMTVEQVWATAGFEAKTTPKIIGGTAVLYGAVGSDLFLIGLDPATGAERWRRPANYSAFGPDQEITVVQVDDRVAYLRDAAPDISVLSQIVLLDPATGIDMVATEWRWWYSLPSTCSDDASTLCASAYYVELDNTLSKKKWRIDKVTGMITEITGDTAAAGPGYTTLWNDVVQIDGATTESIGIVKDGNIVWSKPLADLAGPGATLTHGRYLGEDDGEVPILYLSVAVGWRKAGDGYPALDLAANTVTVGIDRDNGKVLWTQPGTSAGCRTTLPSSRRNMSTPGSPDPALRCRYTGRLDSDPAGRDYGLTIPTDLSVTLERVDLQTGKALWSVPLGDAPVLAVDPDGRTTTFLDDHRLLVNGQVIDVDNGSTRAPTPGETFWCPSPQFFLQSNPWTRNDGSVSYEKQVEGGTFPCDAGGNPATGSPTSVPLAVSTMTTDGLRLVSTPAGVLAYRMPL